MITRSRDDSFFVFFLLTFHALFQITLESELQKRTQLEHQQAELTSTNNSYEREIREASTQLHPIKEQLNTATEDKKDKEMLLETHNNDVKDKLNRIKTRGDRIREMVSSVQKFVHFEVLFHCNF